MTASYPLRVGVPVAVGPQRPPAALDALVAALAAGARVLAGELERVADETEEDQR